MTSRAPALLRHHSGSLLAAGLAAATLVALPATSVAASTAGASTGAAPSPDGTRLSFAFDTGPALSDGDRVEGRPRRSSGTVRSDGARLKRGKGVSGRAVRFPCVTCGRAIIEVPDRSTLDPRTDTFSFGASVRVTPRQAAGSMNVVQKGWYDEVGGQYKLQVDDGVPSCVVSGSAGRATVLSTAYVADGAWHAMACERSGGTVALSVDGSVVASAAVETGHVDNAAPVWVGGKEIGTGDPDQFRGRMDDVFVRILR
ncbi:laminin G domain-containing protein [Nocardioides solisilvae]|uniref:laminin G domain-containing protein n=1 Tax=Nocardioides solisilvae TaxID=1542435 RepID=UPI000D74F8F2|nr:laminin G domain-containing protein [Nocardioides solisilvae]